MHPPLGVKDRQLACAELIEALHACHAQGLLYKFTGRCNGIKHEMNMCLRQERLDRTARNKEAAKAMTAKKVTAWTELDKD